jgi:site-specific DNA recombinase
MVKKSGKDASFYQIRPCLHHLDATAQINKVKNILNMIDNFEEMELEEQNATLKLIIKEIVITKTVETNNEPVIDIHWREL